jgi:Sec-independent protein secretion pathway component TatC
MMALALPMTFFYLIAVLIGYIIQKRKRAAQTAAT